MSREMMQRQARHRLSASKTSSMERAKSLRDKKAAVRVAGKLGVMHSLFGVANGPAATIWPTVVGVEGLAEDATAAERLAEAIYAASLIGDVPALEKALAPLIERAESEDSASEEAAAAAAAAEEAEKAKGSKGGKAAAKGPPAAESAEFAPDLGLEAEGPAAPAALWAARDAYGVEPLARAAARGHLEAVGVLLRSRADVDAREETCNRTALLWAAEAGHAEVVSLLLKHGADMGALTRDGAGAVWVGAHRGHVDVLRELVREPPAEDADCAAAEPPAAGADGTDGTDAAPTVPVDQRDAAGVTPLAAASEAGHGGVCELLMRCNADIDAVDHNGWTALHHACYGGRNARRESSCAEVALALVNAGASERDTSGGQSLLQLHASIGARVMAVVRERRAAEGDEDEDDEDEAIGSSRPKTAP